jgi:hypothetical protein
VTPLVTSVIDTFVYETKASASLCPEGQENAPALRGPTSRLAWIEPFVPEAKLPGSVAGPWSVTLFDVRVITAAVGYEPGPLAWKKLAARGDEGHEDERRQRDQHVNKTADDHAAGPPHRCPLDCWWRDFLHKPHGSAAAPAIRLEDAVGFAGTEGTQVGQHEVAADAAPDEPPALASRTGLTANIAQSLARSGAHLCCW